MPNSLMVKNITPGLMEWGKIKIGRKGKTIRDTFRQPEKLDHFLVTTMEKDTSDNYVLDAELMNRIMERNGTDVIKKIPIMFTHNDVDLIFQTRYACYNGKKVACSGDGETATVVTDTGKQQIQCPCKKYDPEYSGDNKKGKCKLCGCLSCLIGDSNRIGGVWKYRTAGFNSVKSILSSLLLFHRISGGILANIPFSLTVNPKSTNAPNGSPVKIYVVNVEYEGGQTHLRDIGLKMAAEEATHRIRIDRIEDDTRKMLTANIEAEVIGDEEEHAEEFYPDDAAGDCEIIDRSEQEEPEAIQKKIIGRAKNATVITVPKMAEEIFSVKKVNDTNDNTDDDTFFFD